MEQIQISLGHASIQTTERYLGVAQNLTDAPCDHLGVRVQGSSAREPNAPALADSAPNSGNGRKTTLLHFWLRVENNSKLVRGKKRAPPRTSKSIISVAMG